MMATKMSLENVFVLFVPLCNYSISFVLYNVAKLSSTCNRTDGNGIQFETENENLLPCAQVLHKIMNLVVHVAIWPRTVKKCTKIYSRMCRDFVFLIKSYCFLTFLLP